MGDINLRGGSVFHRYGSPPATLKATFTNEASVEVLVGPDNEIFGIIHDALGNHIDSKAAARDVEIPRIAILPQIGPLLENEALLSREHVLRSAETALASRHFRNQLYQLRQAYFDPFCRRAEESWHHLKIESLNVEGEGRDEKFLSLHVRDASFVAEVGWMGHGLQMWLQTMWFLVRAEGAGTVILDEPDVYMHADLQRRLIRLLRGMYSQTLIATHSVEMMSEVEPKNILIVNKARRRSSFASSLPAVQRTIDQMGGVHNIHLARLWGSQRCLHVEGKDIAILKPLQDKIYPTSEAPLDTIPHLSIGGWSGWRSSIGSAMTLENAAGQAIAIYCILDSDYKTEGEISERYCDAARHGVRLHIWLRKEIENYFLIPATIARVIADGVHERVGAPKAEDVRRKIDEIAESMKDGVFDSLSHEFHVRDRASGLHGANRKARQRLDTAWATYERRRDIIPGKDVISSLSDWAQESFGVSFGTQRIVREIRVSELDDEMKSVLRAIERGHNFSRSFAR